MLDDLHDVIEKLRNTIDTRQDYLSRKEMRTRAVLIDPLLRKLGWDVSEPDMVQIEYEIGKKWADYALMSDGKAVAVIEAKALGKPLEDDATDQVHSYVSRKGIPYMIVTDGNRWEMYEVFKQATLEERRLMKFELFQQPAHETALQVLRIWKPNLASGSPKEAMKSVLDTATNDDGIDDDNDGIGKKILTFDDGKTFKEIEGDWTGKKICAFGFKGKIYKEVKRWNVFLVKSCEILSKDYPNQFEDVVIIKLKSSSFNKSGVFSAKDADTHEIGKTGIYINAHMSNDKKKELLEDLVKHFRCDMPVPFEEVG